MPILKTEGLTHIYSAGTPFEYKAIADINFKVEAGEFLGIIGHTGSGKSTLIQHLNGLLKPHEGRVLFKGSDIWGKKEKLREVRFKVGLVFQYPEYQLFDETVFRDIAFGPRNMGLSESEVSERVLRAAEFVQIKEELLEKSPFELSGGEKRRVAIAGVIAMQPEVLILDEPTAGLDPAGRAGILSNIKSFRKETGSAVILVSHDMEEVARNTDRITVMNKGGIEMNGKPEEVFSKSERLLEIGLTVPAVTRVFMRLKELGLKTDTSVYTVEQAKNALLSIGRGSKDA